MGAPRRWSFEKEVRAVRRQFAKPDVRAWSADRPARQMAAELAAPAPNFARLQVDAGAYATWLGVAGVLALADGDPAGWRDLRRSLLYRSLKARMRIATVRRAGAGNPFLDLGEPLALAHALWAGETAVRDRLGGHAVRAYATQPAGVVARFWHTCTPFSRFMAALYGLGIGAVVSFPPDLPDHFGLFAPVIDQWAAPAFPDAFLEVCEGFARGYAHESTDFALRPYSLLPVALLAVLAVRRQVGLADLVFPTVLRAGPAAAAPESPAPEDPLLAELEAVVERWEKEQTG